MGDRLAVSDVETKKLGRMLGLTARALDTGDSSIGRHHFSL